MLKKGDVQNASNERARVVRDRDILNSTAYELCGTSMARRGMPYFVCRE
eukprot:CAMPEP_0174901078 /NCGR_PEP_ID=MMETSP0167-20121228/33468_1 /TAXON_ID=38298 /ORGANISM="Rhodella maculata, Strain CCMP736" /LENGTH=48 /DNA_ID= /DNA_START= /DNA_END= /DNA_ORIENTATION=